jgi:hypothetical protein
VLDELIPKVSSLTLISCVNNKLQNRHASVNLLEQLQQFGKPTWHPYNFGKTRKIGLQQFGKPTWQK